jgi:hypothetical protein
VNERDEKILEIRSRHEENEIRAPLRKDTRTDQIQSSERHAKK